MSEQSNVVNVDVESSNNNNNNNIYYTFHRNSLRHYYNIDSVKKNFIYIVFNLLIWSSYTIGLFFLDEISIEKVSPNYNNFFF